MNAPAFAPRFLALLVTGGLALAPPARAEPLTLPPVVPGPLQVRGAAPFLAGHGVGTQNYVCLPSGTGFAWSLFTPEATLFVNDERQLTTHFFGPNPDEGGTVRAAWQHSRDTSTVWAKLLHASSDAAAPNAIAWLLLEVTGRRAGPDGGDTLTAAKFVQRLATVGGAAPATGCAVAADVGARAFVPYEADYFFYDAGTVQ
jgi:hypothetical protein